MPQYLKIESTKLEVNMKRSIKSNRNLNLIKPSKYFNEITEGHVISKIKFKYDQIKGNVK